MPCDERFHVWWRVQMRSHVLHRTYLWRKWLDARLHALLGARWTPLYAMVAFTRTPYAECRRLRERQDRVRYHMTLEYCVPVVLVLRCVVCSVRCTTTTVTVK